MTGVTALNWSSTTTRERFPDLEFLKRLTRVLDQLSAEAPVALADVDVSLEEDEPLPRALPGLVPAPDTDVASLFEQQAARQPNSPALSLPDRPDLGAGQQRVELSYGELNATANQLARVLAARGVTPGSHVALCLERSVELIVAMLAVVKAGGGLRAFGL